MCPWATVWMDNSPLGQFPEESMECMSAWSPVWPVVAVTAESTFRGKRRPRDGGQRGHDGEVAVYLVQEREPRERRGGRSEGSAHPTAGWDPARQCSLQSCFSFLGTPAARVPS